ncbi:type II secretion system protein [Verrucomicrobiaceae bacterium 227]
MNAKLIQSKKRGFALIAAISVLILMTLVATALLSLSAITVQTSRSEWAEEEARANARLALMIAIGELQRDLGPDRRIAVNAAILDQDPDTLKIDGVEQPHWLGYVKAEYEGNANGSPYTRDENGGGLQDARNGKSYRLRDQIRNYFVSGNDGGRDRIRGGRKYLDALTEKMSVSSKSMVMVGEGSTENPDDMVIVRKMDVIKRQKMADGREEDRPYGSYAWWVTSNSQKAHIGRMDRHQDESLTSKGDGIQRMVHAQDTDISVVEGLSLGVLSKDERVLTPKSLALLNPDNKRGVRENFHALAPYCASTLTSVRDGGLKKNLTAFLNGGGEESAEIDDLDPGKSYYIGLSGKDRLVGPPNPRFAELRDEEFTNSKYEDVSPTFELIWNWARLAKQFEFGNAKTGIRAPKIWENPPFKGGGGNVFDGENLKPTDPRNLSVIKMTPVIVEAAMYYHLATYPEGSGSSQRHVLRQCLYPRVGLWNPYNAELRLDKPMILQLFLNGKKAVEFDGDPNFTREIYYGGRRNEFDGQYGGQVYFMLPAVTIPPGETFIFSMGGAPRELDINNFGANLLQANSPPSSASYLYKDYRIDSLSGTRAGFARDDDGRASEFMPRAPVRFRERPLDFRQHGADNYMFMLKYLESGASPTRNSFPSEPMLIYASVSLQAGGGDEYPLEWAPGTGAPVYQLSGAGAHIPAGVPPHPFTRDGFRVRWLDETDSNKGAGGINRQFLQSSALGNWNLRASYITRTPFDNVTSQAPYFHGIYTRDNPSDEMSWDALTPVARGGFQTGFPFGPAGFGVDSVVAFEVPTQEVGMPSLGYLRHLQLSEYVWHPSYSIGSSIADPRVEITGTMPARNVGSSHGWNAPGFGTDYWATLFKNIVFELADERQLIFDMSYEVNHNLWSDYFLTGGTKSQIANFAQDPIGKPLDNGNLILWDRTGDPAEDLEDFFRAASRLMIEGGFDVHSTSKEAWKALLSSTRDVGYGSLERSPFPRTLFPKGEENTRAEYSTKVFTGFRSLGDQEIDSLAEAIVREVKIRAPFFGMDDFVNRRLTSDETGRRGALESALENSLPNRGMDGKFPIDRSPLVGQGPIIAEGNPNQATTTPMDQESLPASTGYGTPGYITQGDVLQVIGSTLVARSDTFTVRAYGESKDVNGKVLARAWCESTVQRTPEPIAPDAITGLNPREPQGNEVDFGRRFRIISFRWLPEDEV